MTKASVLETYALPDPVLDSQACGLTNLRLDPAFETNHFIYVSYCVDEEVTRLMRYTWSEETGVAEGAVIVETVVENKDLVAPLRIDGVRGGRRDDVDLGR